MTGQTRWAVNGGVAAVMGLNPVGHVEAPLIRATRGRTMGYDLNAKRPRRGAASYYRSGIEFMTFLRSAMVAAGVPEALVYKKFISNDNLLVTPMQSRMIAKRLTRWLHRRNLTLDPAETNQWARASTDSLFFVLQAVGNQKDEARLARSRRAKSLPLRLHRRARKTLREFAAFCAGSGGFYVS